MLKKVVGLFIILGSITFAQWEKEYVKNELGQPTDIYYYIYKGQKGSPSILFSKSNLIIQLKKRVVENLYTSSLVIENIKIIDEKGKTHSLDAGILMDIDNSIPYSIIVNRKNKMMIDLMRNNNTLIFQFGKGENEEKFEVSFYNFDAIYEETERTGFVEEK